MKSTKYLYGCDLSDLPPMEEGLTARIEKAKELLQALLDVHYSEQDTSRINAVAKALQHNTKLLKGEV